MASCVALFLALLATGIQAICQDDRDEPKRPCQAYTPAKAHDFPYLVDLDGCTGTVLSPDWVLTAAHCGFDKATRKERPIHSVMWGSNIGAKGRRVEVERAVIHPRCEITNSNPYDFMLLKLRTPLQFSPHRVGAMKIAGHHVDLKAGTEGLMLGLGYEQSADALERIEHLPKRLMKHRVEVIRTEECRAHHPGIDLSNLGICANSSALNPCDDNTGGPWIVHGVMVGLASAVTDHACGPADPLVFASLPPVRDWIRYQMRRPQKTTTQAPVTGTTYLTTQYPYDSTSPEVWPYAEAVRRFLALDPSKDESI